MDITSTVKTIENIGFQSVNLLGIDVRILEIWSFFIIGSLFIFYFFLTFLQRQIHNGIRLSLSGFFLVVGLLFMNLGGKLITGYDFEFTLIVILNSFMLALVGLIIVYIIYQRNLDVDNE